MKERTCIKLFVDLKKDLKEEQKTCIELFVDLKKDLKVKT